MLSITILTFLFIYSTYGEDPIYIVNQPFGGKFNLNPILPYNTWGTFRSGHYFGMKTSSPDSIVMGMMWFTNQKEQKSLSIRHFCNSNDNLESFGWLSHDFWSFGVQHIVDHNLTLSTSFLKFSDNTWTAKITAKSKHGREDTPMSLILYVAKESKNDSIETVPFNENSTFEVHAHSQHFEKFHISISVAKHEENVLYRSYLNAHSDPPLVSLTETLLKHLHIKTFENSNPLFVIEGEKNSNPNTNFIPYQIIFNSSIEINVHFQSENEKSDNNSRADKSYDSELKMRSENFDNSFDLKFNLSEKEFNTSEINFGKAALSNMLGSIGYFNGYLPVLSNYTPKPVPYGPLQLLTAVPVKSVFPRGFLWDEGFHQLIINNWDMELSLTVIKSWFNVMNAEGWIPREITLGYDAIARIPSEAIVQTNTHANPPSLLLTLDYILNSGKVKPEFFINIFPRLQIWYDWYNTSQVGQFPSTYRWRGRDSNSINQLNPVTLTSGLDDYPRASHPTDDEIHVDLRCWMALASKVMSKIAHLINDSSVKKYSETAEYLYDNTLLEKWHWSEKYQMFLDKGLHSTNVTLVQVKNEHGKTELQRKVLTPPKYDFVPDIGYVSLFPLMFNIINSNNTKLGKVLDHLENSNFLWSEYGIRSLSRNSVYYQRDNPGRAYWRGAIWINLNYLTLKSLHHYSQISGPYQSRASSIYQRLRHNLISIMYREYVVRGYIWEQYDDRTGKGDFSHPFTGWSSLILLIMSEKY